MNARAAALALLLPALGRQALPACTLWAAAGPQAGQGTLLSKNRDWRPDHRQALALVRPASGLAYLGLFAEGNQDPGLKAGVNERGLSVVVASSNIPRAERSRQPGRHGVLARIRELLAGGGPFSLERFAEISRDRHDGPDDSLWRDGREHTLASWIVAAPPAGPVRLRVLLANPGEPERLREFSLDDGFWRRTPAGGI